MSRVARVHQAGPDQPTANLALFDAEHEPASSVGPLAAGQLGRRSPRYALARASNTAVLGVREAPPSWAGGALAHGAAGAADASPHALTAAMHGVASGPVPERPPRERRWPIVRVAKGAGALSDALPVEPGSPVEVIEERCHSLLRANDAPDLPYRLAVNPYRGCEHACVGCELADVSGSTGSLSSATRRIYAKVNAAECLREELRRPGYLPRPINLGSATDVYQPVERRLRLTRALIELLHETGHPFALATRSAGVVRDLDLLSDLAARQQVLVLMGLTRLDAGLSRTLEPGASPPALRLAAMRTLAQAGVWVGVNLAPLQTEIDDEEIEALLAAAAQAGARSVHWRLPHGVAGSDGPGLTARQRVARHAEALGLSLSLPTLDSEGFRPPSRSEPEPSGQVRQRDLF